MKKKAKKKKDIEVGGKPVTVYLNNNGKWEKLDDNVNPKFLDTVLKHQTVGKD